MLAPFRALIVAVGAALDAVGIPLVGDPRRGIFRIYRDVRFSPDKRLYKTHAGAVLTRSGGKRDPGLLYLHIEPGASEAGMGFWRPEPDLLARLRRSILDDPDGFLDMVAGLEARGFKLTTDARLSRPPRGFEAAKGTAVADYVCWKTFITEIAFSDAEMQSPDLVHRIVDFALAARLSARLGLGRGNGRHTAAARPAHASPAAAEAGFLVALPLTPIASRWALPSPVNGARGNSHGALPLRRWRGEGE